MNVAEDFDVVTGAFGQTGHAIANELLRAGRTVKTITRAPQSMDPTGKVQVIRADFDNPERLTQSLQGCRMLYSGIWARFSRRGNYDHIVRAIDTLFQCAKEAGVERIVKITVAGGGERTKDLPYWMGKAEIERKLRALGVPHSIIRPTLIFSRQDTVINNVAWAMRHLKVVPIPWGGPYPICPVAVADMGALAVREGQREGDNVVEAVGPETLDFGELMRVLRDALGVRCMLPRVPPAVALAGSKLMAPFLRDTLISRYEMKGLVRGVYDVSGPVNCPTEFSSWARENGALLGRRYHSQRRRSQAREWPNRFEGA